MSSGNIEPKGSYPEKSVDLVDPKDETESRRVSHVDVKQSEILVNQDLMNDAVHGENREHKMSMWQATKDHPWACLWAFTMSFTIVCLFPRI